MFEGVYADYVLTHPYVKPDLPKPQETSGTRFGTDAIFRYSLKDSDYPVIIISDPIYDNAGGIIKPGYYELALSDARDFLILLQSKEAIAIIPVIKIEEDATEQQRLNNKKVKKELKKEEKNRKTINEKRKKEGMKPDEPEINMEASIEYIPKGKYYLIKYQRGTIKAWGAFKG